MGFYYLLGNVTVHIVLTSNPHNTVSVTPGKEFVQIYSAAEWETGLAEEQLMGKKTSFGGRGRRMTMWQDRE